MKGKIKPSKVENNVPVEQMKEKSKTFSIRIEGTLHVGENLPEK